MIDLTRWYYCINYQAHGKMNHFDSKFLRISNSLSLLVHVIKAPRENWHSSKDSMQIVLKKPTHPQLGSLLETADSLNPDNT